jgi:hypothetical protein
MFIARVECSRFPLFQHFLTKLKITTNKVHIISNGAAAHYGTYINQDVVVYGFLSADQSLYDQLEDEVRLDANSKTTYVNLGSGEFFF